jgi:hypothetical protein
MHFTTNSKKLSSHQLNGKIHFITVHIIHIKPLVVNQMRIYNFNELFKWRHGWGETDMKYSKVI